MLREYIHEKIQAKYEIYNNPQSSEEMQSTQKALWDLFVNRDDAYVVAEMGSHGATWRTVRQSPTQRMIRKHIRGDITIGAYQIDKDDKCKWICFDIDDHNTFNSVEDFINDLHKPSSKEKCERIMEVLDNEHIEYQLEASGSIGSYHIWIFLSPTNTRNAYLFARKISRLASVDGIECFPKQATIIGKQLGSMVKIPLGVNKKNDIRSKFVGHDFNDIDHVCGSEVLVLTYIPEEISIRSKGYKGVTFCEKQDLLPCEWQVIEEKIPLENFSGHNMRLAICRTAILAGYNDDQIVDLFRHQIDFDEGFTRGKIEDLRSRNYRFSCAWVMNNCTDLVKHRCPDCERFK